MAYAKAAERSGYPAPAHVLALAAQLRLGDAQFSALTVRPWIRHNPFP